MSCKKRNDYFDVCFSHCFRYDVNDQTAMIGCRTEGQQEKSRPEVDLMLHAETQDRSYERNAQSSR